MSKIYDTDENHDDSRVALEELVKTIPKWHKTTMDETRDILLVQEGTEINVHMERPIQADEQPAPLVLKGELLRAFKMGIVMSMAKFEDLPFQVSLSEGESIEDWETDFPMPSNHSVH